MDYRILSEIGRHYQNEEGTEGVRRVALGGLENLLLMHYARADVVRNAARNNNQPAANLPAVGAGRVRALAAFHQQRQALVVDPEQINAEIIRIRQWLHRQNAVVSPDGHINWARSVKTVVYDRQLADQNTSKITFRGGQLYTADGKLLDTANMVTHFSGPGYAIYVMSWEGNMHVSSHSVGYRHHSSLLAGGMVAGAGEIRVSGGRINWISNKSGHYKPDVYHLLQTLHSIWLNGVPLDFQIAYMSAAGTNLYGNFTQFAIAQGFDASTVESLQILHGYGHHLTAEFLVLNQLVWIPSTQGVLLGGIYDMSVNPARRVSFDEFTRKMHLAGMLPRNVFASGVGR